MSCKSLYAAVAALALAFAACTQVEPIGSGISLKEGSDAAPEAIALMPLTYTPTKSIITGTAFPDTSTIVAAAWFNPNTGATGSDVKYFDNYTFKKGQGLLQADNAKWGADKTAYWPVMGSLCIMAFRPDTTSNNVTPTWTDSTTLKLKIANLRDDQDILVGANRDARKGADAITFYHLNSLIEVKVKSSQDFTTQSGDSHPSGIELLGVTIDSVYTTINDFTATRTDGANTFTYTGSASGDYNTLTILDKAVGTDSVRLSTTARTVNGETNKPWDNSKTEPGKRVIVLSQTPHSMTIYYKLYNGGSATGSPELKCNGIPLKVSDEESSNVWSAGKKYVYTVTVNADKITITPSVHEWTDQSKDVTVESH